MDDPRLDRYLALLAQWNRRINLVAQGDLARLRERHVDDSLALARLLPSGPLRVADLGSGAGFPGVPLALTRPDLRLDLVECKTKAAAFLSRVRADLNLPNVTVVQARVEDYTPEPPPDVVISRAAFPPPLLLEHAARLLGPGGLTVVMYGAGAVPEESPAFQKLATQERPGRRINVLYRRL